jgi:hypothetical protein
MNSYNDNLHNSVVSSLSEQEIALQSITGQYNAAEDTLYYRQGNRVTTYEKLQLATLTQKFYQEAREKTVENSNFSINVQEAADKSKSYLNKTVSNTSAAAANVQIASNAILKLASDVGSIFSIVNAANFESEIYYLSLRCKERMDETAFNAEAVSDTSMKSTASVSQVPINDLKKRADAVNASIQELQVAVNSEFEKANEKVKSESTKLEIATNAEKKAEGNLLVRQREYNSTRIAYNITNRELNLDLDVSGIDSAVNVKEQKAEIVVSFKDYKSPFSDPLKKITNDPEVYEHKPYYPVDVYNVFVVKYQKQATFALSNGEELVTQYPLEIDGKKSPDVRYNVIERADIESNHKIIETISMCLEGDSSKPFNPHFLQLDTDGDPIVLGDQYVVFVMGVFDPKYKKAINNFEDYLTGSSENFTLEVNIPYPVKIKENAKNKSEILFEAKDEIIKEELNHLGIDAGDPLVKNPIQYRCMFLPVLAKNVKESVIRNSMLTYSELTEMAIDSAQHKNNEKVYKASSLSDRMSRIADLDRAIISEDEKLKAELQEQIKVQEGTIKHKKSKIEEHTKEFAQAEKEIKNIDSKIDRIEKSGRPKAEKEREIKEENKTRIEHENKLNNLKKSIEELTEEINKEKQTISNLEKDIKDQKKEENMLHHESEIGFIFDSIIASKIPASNYTVATSDDGDVSIEDSPNKFKVEIKPETTDNFGNRLIEGNHYLPAVLAVFDPSNSNKDKFGVSLSISKHIIKYEQSN